MTRPYGSTRSIFHGLMMVPLLLCWLVVPAAADDEEALQYNRTGVYLGFSAVGALGLDRTTGSVLTEGGGGLNVRAGTRESARLAYEAEFEWVMLSQRENNNYVYGINTKFFFMDERLQPFMVLGANGMTQTRVNEASQTDWGFRFGAGTDYYLTKRIAATFEVSYILGVGQVFERDYLSFGLGAVYRF
jgi:hypothetical protein